MASMQCYKEEGREFDYYSYGNQKPNAYSSSGYEQSYYEKEKCYEAKPGMMGYGPSHGHQHGSNPMMGHGKLGHGMGHNGSHGGMGYGMGHNGNHGVYGAGHNMHKPASNGLGSGLGLGLGLGSGSNTPLGHVMGFGKKHEGHGSYGMGSSGCNSYKKQHRRRRGYGSGSGSDCSDSSDDERRC